jgi:hypothetical protein
MDHVDVCRAGAGVDDVGVAVRRDVVDDLADIDHRPPRLAQAYRQDEAAPVLDHAADSSEHHTTSLPPSAQEDALPATRWRPLSEVMTHYL